MSWGLLRPALPYYLFLATQCPLAGCGLRRGWPTRQAAQRHADELVVAGFAAPEVVEYKDGVDDTCPHAQSLDRPMPLRKPKRRQVTPRPTHRPALPERPDDDRIRALGGEGTLVARDLPELSAAKQAIYTLVRDGRWHSAHEIRDIAAGGQSEGLRRMRELRDYGFDIEARRGSDRLFWYRLVHGHDLD